MFIFVFKQHDIKFVMFYIILKYKEHFNSMNNVISLSIYFNSFFSNSNYDVIITFRKINNQILDL